MNRDIDINCLAKLIYENPEIEEKTKKSEKIIYYDKLPNNVSDYHNKSFRGQNGLNGEDVACNYLQENGYIIEKRNFRCYVGEIDIVAVKNGVWHFVEVKTRSSLRYGNPREAVTYTKQKKIRRSAESYLKMREMLQNIPPLSFDVIEVILSYGKIKSVNHLEGCF